jgi:hypothetical protein
MGKLSAERESDFELLPLADEPGCYMAVFEDGSYFVGRAESFEPFARRLSEERL